MGFLIGYLLGFAFTCTYRFKTMDGINSMKIVLSSIFYPLEILIRLVNFITIPLGVYLQFEIACLLSEKELKNMTDKTIQELSDRLHDLVEKEDDNEEK